MVGALCGYTLSHFVVTDARKSADLTVSVAVIAALTLLGSVLFLLLANGTIRFIDGAYLSFVRRISGMSLLEVIVAAGGLMAGLIVANLVSIPIGGLPVIGMPLAVALNVTFGAIGMSVSVFKKGDSLLTKRRDGVPEDGRSTRLLDSSAIIDGRLVEIIKSGFLEGDITVPSYILEELRAIADSQDQNRRARGRRGLDVLDTLQKEYAGRVSVRDYGKVPGLGADDMLLATAGSEGCTIVTNDYNLSKVAAVKGVRVLNINYLAKAVKPAALPGEELAVKVVREGKEEGQGVAYLDDGTMIVVESGKRYVNEPINVYITSVIQTAAGKMVFAKVREGQAGGLGAGSHYPEAEAKAMDGAAEGGAGVVSPSEAAMLGEASGGQRNGEALAGPAQASVGGP